MFRKQLPACSLFLLSLKEALSQACRPPAAPNFPYFRPTSLKVAMLPSGATHLPSLASCFLYCFFLSFSSLTFIFAICFAFLFPSHVSLGSFLGRPLFLQDSLVTTWGNFASLGPETFKDFQYHISEPPWQHKTLNNF